MNIEISSKDYFHEFLYHLGQFILSLYHLGQFGLSISNFLLWNILD